MSPCGYKKGKKDKGYYKHDTHKSYQSREESVSTSGDGFTDAFIPKSPKTDYFYYDVSNWNRK